MFKVKTSHGIRADAIDTISAVSTIPFAASAVRAGLASEAFSNMFRYISGNAAADAMCANALVGWKFLEDGRFLPGMLMSFSFYLWYI